LRLPFRKEKARNINRKAIGLPYKLSTFSRFSFEPRRHKRKAPKENADTWGAAPNPAKPF
jgi:hypothetical protein